VGKAVWDGRWGWGCRTTLSGVEWSLWDSLSVFTGLSFPVESRGETHDLMV
jgi:hypothetical protein